MPAKQNDADAGKPLADDALPGLAGEPPESDVRTPDTLAGITSGPRFRIVGIGSSAGGLEALMEFLQAMRPDSGMAFAVVSHLDPEHKSALSEILGRVSPMPVREVEDGNAVVPNHVFIMPPNRNMSLAEGIFHLTPRVDARVPQMPIDAFLRSLAEDCGNRAVGVILSGTGTDGTLGLKAIKDAGGLTFVQDDTAKYKGMPQSAAAGADAILPPAQIAAELFRISSQPPAPRVDDAPLPEGSPEEHVFLEILRLLSDSTGVDFVHYKHATLRRRIERRMVIRRLEKLADYLQDLRDNAPERQLLFEEVLIPVTNFFREPDSFEVLKTTILPRLLADRPLRTPFRVWVPGCSTGEEVYSIAICLLEHLGTRAEAVPIKIFATDVSDRVIETARAGIYSEGITSDVSAQRLQRFFLKTERGYQISRTVRDLCVFARHDMTRDPPFSQLDLVSCRNVLIYLGPALQERVLPIFHYALRPEGILVLGGSEAVGGFTNLFDVVDRKHKFYVRTATPSRLTFDFVPGLPLRTSVGPDGGPERTRGLPDVYRDADRVVLARYAPSGVVVDENLHIVQFRGDTGAYLKPAPGPPTTELLLLAREGLLGDLRDMLDRARRENVPVRKDGVRVKTNGHFEDVDLQVLPLPDPTSATRHFVVLFEAPHRAAGAHAAAPHAPAPSALASESDKDREISHLKHDLSATKLYLQSVIEQKEAANEELWAANEEVVCANEELQSANEELTTTQEELQGMNEELTTVNDELQNRIRVTNQLSDDLSNLIETTKLPVIVLGTDLCVRRFTPSAQDVMNLRPGDIGRPLGELKSKIHVPDLEQLVREVIDTLEIKQVEVADEAGVWYKLYVRPYKTMDHQIAGVVLMFMDIDTLKRRELEIREARDYASNIVETIREPLIVLDGELRVRTANRSFYRDFQASPPETEGRPIFELGDGQWNIPRLRDLLEHILPQNDRLDNFEVEHVFPRIGKRTMSLNACRVQGAGMRGPLILLAIEDVTSRSPVERLRRETEERLRAMVDTAVSAIFAFDEHGTIHSVNAATERMFGYSASELIGQNVSMLKPASSRDDSGAFLMPEPQMGQNPFAGSPVEIDACRKDGTTFPVDVAVSEYKDRGQRMFTGVLRDLTARKSLEREVMEVATLEQQRIGQELHDTTAQELTALGLLAESLVAAFKPESSIQSTIVTKMAEGLKRVLGQVRAIARGLIRVELDAEGLMAALAELASQNTENRGLVYTFDCPKPVHLTNNQTATQLYCIAREAVTNALKHARAQKITVALESEDRSVTLRVWDDGVGFWKGKPDPDGMGLKIMHYRAGLINARLSVGLTESGGTLVTCTCNKDAQHV